MLRVFDKSRAQKDEVRNEPGLEYKADASTLTALQPHTFSSVNCSNVMAATLHSASGVSDICLSL
jgi:hypothetical protein